MSNVKIKANASGTADFTLEAPATDSALTLTLPDTQGTLVTDAAGDIERAFSTQIGGRRNLIINGAMQVAQRGTSETGVTTTDGYYACDRWRTQTDTGTWTISQSTDAPDGFSSSLKIDCTAAGSDNADEVSFTQRIEGQNVQHLAYGTSSAKQITVSFWVKTNKTGTFSVSLSNSDATKNVAASFTVSSADTWEYKTATFDGDTAAGFDNDNGRSLDLYIHFGATTAYQSASYDDNWAAFDSSTWLPEITGIGGSADDYVNITGVQLEVGSVATPFEHRSYGEELALCQRYFEGGHTGNNYWMGVGDSSSGNNCSGARWAVEKRASPTCEILNISEADGSAFTDGTVSVVSATQWGFNRWSSSGGSSVSTGRPYRWTMTIDAEL